MASREKADLLWRETASEIGRRRAPERQPPHVQGLATHLTRAAGRNDPEFAAAVAQMLQRYATFKRQAARVLQKAHASPADFPGSGGGQLLVDGWLDELAEGPDQNAPPEAGRSAICLNILIQQQAWLLDRQQPGDPPLRPVLQPVLEHWYAHGAHDVEMNSHERPFVPSNLFLDGSEQSALAGMLTAAARQSQDSSQLLLPGIADLDQSQGQYLPGLRQMDRGRSLPLLYWDLGRKNMSRGRGAAPGLRLMIGCLMAYGREHWHDSGDMRIPLEELMRMIWPETDLAGKTRRLPRTKQRQAFYRATDALHSVAAMFPDTERGKLIRLVTFQDLPLPLSSGLTPEELRQEVTVRIELPAGCESGPRIDRWLLPRLGVVSAPAYRLYLNLIALWWQPGRTRRKNKAGAWFQSQDEKYYDPISDDQLIDMCNPNTTYRQRRNLKKGAFNAVHLLRRHNVLRITQSGKLLPAREATPVARD